MPIHNQIGLEKWFVKEAKTWVRLFPKNHVGSLKDKHQGPYKKKGTIQSLWTQQHNCKKEKDWTKKMRTDGYRSLKSFFGNKAVASDTNGNAQEIHSHSHSNLVSDLDTNDIQSGPGSHLLVSAVDSSDENDDNPNFTTHSTPEREKDNLGDVPEVTDTGSTTMTQWIPSCPPPKALLAPQIVDQQIGDLEKILHPKRKTGYGYIDIKMNYTLHTHLEMMLQFLRIYQFNGYEAWVASSAQAATISGHYSPWMARRL